MKLFNGIAGTVFSSEKCGSRDAANTLRDLLKKAGDDDKVYFNLSGGDFYFFASAKLSSIRQKISSMAMDPSRQMVNQCFLFI